jgi:ribosome maturation factor RimP
MEADINARLEGVINPLLGESGLDLVNLKVNRQGRDVVIEILADRPRGGITISECTRVNRQLVQRIEEEKLLGEEYSVTVSSPGIDWPLQTRKDFLRVLNRTIRFMLTEPVDERLEYEGKLERVDDDQVAIDVRKSLVIIPMDKIKKAVQIIN